MLTQTAEGEGEHLPGDSLVCKSTYESLKMGGCVATWAQLQRSCLPTALSGARCRVTQPTSVPGCGEHVALPPHPVVSSPSRLYLSDAKACASGKSRVTAGQGHVPGLPVPVPTGVVRLVKQVEPRGSAAMALGTPPLNERDGAYQGQPGWPLCLEGVNVNSGNCSRLWPLITDHGCGRVLFHLAGRGQPGPTVTVGTPHWSQPSGVKGADPWAVPEPTHRDSSMGRVIHTGPRHWQHTRTLEWASCGISPLQTPCGVFTSVS